MIKRQGMWYGLAIAILLLPLGANAVTEAELVEAERKYPVLNLATNGLSYGDVLQAEFEKKFLSSK